MKKTMKTIYKETVKIGYKEKKSGKYTAFILKL